MTTSDYLTQLQQDRDNLVDNLTTKGITGLTGDETFTELVPEVLNIPSGGADLSEYFNNTISASSSSGVLELVKKIPNNITLSGNSMQNLFKGYTGSSFPTIDTSSVINMNAAFQGCINMTTPPITTTPLVTNISSMFDGCTSLTGSITLSLPEATNITSTFQNCSSLNSVILTIPKAQYVNSIFKGCTSLTSVTLNNSNKIMIVGSMFEGCSNLESISMPNGTGTCANAAASVFKGCSKLETAPYLNLSGVYSISSMFQDCSELKNIPAYTITSTTMLSNAFKGVTKLTNESLNNVLATCISASSYGATKTLYYLFGNVDMSQYYPSSTIQGLSNYQTFINAGWTIGW